MKKAKKILLILSIILLFNGCSIKNENTMKITKDGEVNYSIVIAFDRELLSNVIKTQYLSSNEYEVITDEVMKEYLNSNIKDYSLEGLNKRDYSDDNFIGIEYQYNANNIDDISSSKTEKIVLNNLDQEEKLIDKKLFSKKDDVYTANFVYEKIDDSEYSKENINYYNLFKVTLPTASKNNNANKITDNGKTLIWEMNSNEKCDINFSFKLNDYTYIYFISLLAVIVISIIVIYTIKIKKEVKK